MSDRTPKPCAHPGGHHRHGTRVTYVADKCRCEPCTLANREYAARQHRAVLCGRVDLVDAAPVRNHLRALMGAGIGAKKIARLAGVSRGVVAGILYGDPASGRAPSRRIRTAAATALLAVNLDPKPAPAAPARRQAVQSPRLLRPTPAAPRRTSIAELGDPDADWRTSALCAQVGNADLWFPDKGQSANTAKRICARCPVADPCAEFANRNQNHYGIYGGRSAATRRKATA